MGLGWIKPYVGKIEIPRNQAAFLSAAYGRELLVIGPREVLLCDAYGVMACYR
jgi:hypothetical protein